MSNDTAASPHPAPGDAGVRSDDGATTTSSPRCRWHNQPGGLFSLAGVELWERFSYYALQVILGYFIYYSTTRGGLGLPESVAVGVVGAYGAMVYVSQLLGGWLADRLIAPRRVVLGAVVMMIVGFATLALLPGTAGLAAGLALIVLGIGGLKVNVTSMVGMLYPEAGPARSSGYALYYMGITIGAFLGPLASAIIQSTVGFRLTFGFIAVVMLIGLGQYLAGYRRLSATTATVVNPLPAAQRPVAIAVSVLGVATVAVAVATGVITLSNINNFLIGVVVVCITFYFTTLLGRQGINANERSRVVTYVPVFLSIMVFWTLLLQKFTTIAVYVDSRVVLELGPLSIPPAMFLTFQSFVTVILAPLYVAMWAKLGRREPSPGAKIFLGISLLAIALLILATMHTSTGPVNPAMVVLFAIFLIGAGDVAVVPAALAVTADLAPTKYKGQMMALYFLTMAAGSSFAGLIAQAYRPDAELGFFLANGVGALVVGAGLYLIYRRMSQRAAA